MIESGELLFIKEGSNGKTVKEIATQSLSKKSKALVVMLVETMSVISIFSFQTLL